MTTAIKFHGEVVENEDNHRHYRANPADLVGKTIEAFDCSADNIWRLRFTDGTAVAIEADTVGAYHIPAMLLCDTCWETA